MYSSFLFSVSFGGNGRGECHAQWFCGGHAVGKKEGRGGSGFRLGFFVLLLVAGLADDGVDHEEIAEEAHSRSHFDVTGIEDGFIEGGFGGTGTRHQNHADNHNCHAHGQQNEVDAVERKNAVLFVV